MLIVICSLKKQTPARIYPQLAAKSEVVRQWETEKDAKKKRLNRALKINFKSIAAKLINCSIGMQRSDRNYFLLF